MAKVLQRLVRHGLLQSHQGTHGGYRLARGPALISVADVIQAIEGPVAVTACTTNDGQCEQFSKCNVRDPLLKLRERILSALGRVHDRRTGGHASARSVAAGYAAHTSLRKRTR